MLHLSLEKSDVKFRYLEKLYHFFTKFVNIFRYFFLYLQILWSYDSFSIPLIYLALLVTCFLIFLTILVGYWPFGQYWRFLRFVIFFCGSHFYFFWPYDTSWSIFEKQILFSTKFPPCCTYLSKNQTSNLGI
jgi:hypothetical protein